MKYQSYSDRNVKIKVNFMLSQKTATFIAHNAKAYDTWLIHQYVISKTGHKPNKLFLAGNKIMQMKMF